jgi:hypothetical protein
MVFDISQEASEHLLQITPISKISTFGCLAMISIRSEIGFERLKCEESASVNDSRLAINHLRESLSFIANSSRIIINVVTVVKPTKSDAQDNFRSLHTINNTSSLIVSSGL